MTYLTNYTVLLSVPDSDCEGWEATYLWQGSAYYADAAITAAREEAMKAHSYDGFPDEYKLLFMCEGHPEDLTCLYE